MKKAIGLILTLVLMLGLFAGCSAPSDAADALDDSAVQGGEPADGGEPAEGGEEQSVPTVEPGVLKVALSPDFSPMEFCDVSKTGQDQYVGFDVMLANFIADELGLTLEINAMSFDSCQVAVQMGNVDMSISGFSKTPEREANCNLSDFYYAGDNETEQTIIVLKDKEGTFTSASDFDGLKVGAQASSLQYNLVTEQLPNSEVVVFTDIATGLLQLQNGDFDAMAVAVGNAEALISANDNVAMSGFMFDVTEEQQNNVILLPKGADEMTDAVNAILAKAYEAGYYAEWYAEAKELAGIETAQEVTLPDEPADGAEGESGETDGEPADSTDNG